MFGQEHESLLLFWLRQARRYLSSAIEIERQIEFINPIVLNPAPAAFTEFIKFTLLF